MWNLPVFGRSCYDLPCFGRSSHSLFDVYEGQKIVSSDLAPRLFRQSLTTSHVMLSHRHVSLCSGLV